MAEIVVSASKGVIGRLLAKLTELMENKSANLLGVSKNIAFLKDELPTMNALLEKLEDADELDPLVKAWRNQARELGYDIEDCIDDFAQRVGGADVDAGFIDKISHFLKTLRARLETAEHIKDLKIRLLEINERHKRYKFSPGSPPSSSSVAIDRRLPALYTESANLVGFEGPREEVIKCLIDTDQRLMVLPIVGFGGLGKTTLANEVYKNIREQFRAKAFVPVSQKPDIVRLLSGIQSKLEISVSSPCFEVKDIIDSIRVYLQHRRYLVVVDDLWDAPTWDIIGSVFPENGMGCRVIVTTRVEDVARRVCSNHQEFIYRMKPLSDEDSRRLFFNRIFVSEDNCPAQLRDISYRILRKCCGLPLAIVTISSLLASRPEPRRKEWENIQNSIGTWGSGTNPTLEGVRQILYLSYKDLPHHLRTCFLYLGIYPEDFTIKRDDLIRQWVAEGFVHNIYGRNLEEDAKSYFNELINRSLIQPKETEYGEVVSCTVHDMMLDMILNRCVEDNFIHVVYNLQEVEGQHEFKVRRLLLDSRAVGSDDAKISATNAPRLLQLRSLQMFGGPLSLLLLSKHLRVLILHLGKPGTDGNERVDLTAIGQLFQLRYLKIVRLHPAPLVVELPAEIKGLEYLSALEIDYTSESNLPLDIVRLPCLSHLIVPSGIGLPHGHGIGRMKSLCTLKNFEIVDIRSATGLGELTNLKDLELDSRRALSGIEIDALVTSLGKLHKLVYLRTSALQGGCFCDDENNQLSSLSHPPLHIERLNLVGWRLRRVPKWINGNLQNLCLLSLAVTEMSTDEVRVLGELPSLIKLILLVKRLPPCGAAIVFTAAGFPELECMEFACGGDVMSRMCFEPGVMPKLQRIVLFYLDDQWSGTAPAGIEHLLNLRLRDIQLLPICDDRTVAEDHIKTAFTETIKAHRSRGGAEPYLHFSRLRKNTIPWILPDDPLI
ncbi:hypothetical protein U9M48_032423 [Paspalum notatum var. saurae]|uniref:Uncharacterized protein n=1 Tax=Paspalum notatum var. saurae TaxID=547442 RepID=A0AAQ3U524_PASNO